MLRCVISLAVYFPTARFDVPRHTDHTTYALFIILQEVKREVNEGNENGEYRLFSFGSINKNGRYIFDDIFQLSESTTVHHHYGYENAA